MMGGERGEIGEREGGGASHAGGRRSSAAAMPMEVRAFERLLAHGAVEGPDAVVVNLLRACGPYEVPLGRKQRVATRLAEAGRIRRRPMLLRPVVALTVLLGGGAIASAALWQWPQQVAQGAARLLGGGDQAGGVRRTSRLGRSHSSPTESAGPRAAGHEGDAPSLAAGDRAMALADERAVTPTAAAPAAAPASQAALAVPHRAKAAAPVAFSRSAAGLPSTNSRDALAPASGEDTALILAAVRALRRAHDPGQARRLLASYLERHPQDGLAEEALALSIEAAVAHRDPDAGALALRYLKLYPQGPFQALARRTLNSQSP